MTSPQDANAELVEQLTRQVEQNPDSTTAHVKLGTALLRRGKTKRAETELRAAIALDANCAPALINLGGILLSRGDFGGCVEMNRQAAAAAPEEPLAYYNQGLGHLYLADKEAMVECFRKVVELDDSHAAGHYHLAVGLLACNEGPEARQHLSKAMQLGYKPEPRFLKAMEKKDKKKGGENPPVVEITPNSEKH